MPGRPAHDIHGPALRAIRQARGIKVDALAETVHVTRAYITNLELGHRRTISPELYSRILAALGVSDPRAMRINPYDHEDAA